jgi:cardiolipin synthase
MKNEVVLMDDAYYHCLLDNIHLAKKSIQLETYIFENDAIGTKILNALCDAAKRGVKVKVLIDGIGSRNWPPEMTKKLLSAGGKLKIYHPLPWILSHFKLSSTLSNKLFNKFFTLLSYINNRNHKKVCVIDKKIAFIGSANISDYPSIDDPEIKWHDITVKFIGKTEELQYAFNLGWSKKLFSNMKYKINPNIRLNYTWEKRRKLYRDLINKIKQSKNRIWITCPYFIPNIFLLRHLARASKRNVDVCIILSRHSDIIGLSLLIKTFYSYLLKKNITVLEYPAKKILHEKILIIDDWVCVGSSNVNSRSLRHDLEADYCLSSDVAKTIIINHVKKHQSESEKITKNHINKLSFFEKCVGKILLIFKGFC